MNRLARFDTIELFGTLLEGDDYGFLFAPEDDTAHAFWLSSNIASWEPTGDSPGQGVAAMPRWIARKRRCISEPPDDDDPAWHTIAKIERRYFAARAIKISGKKIAEGRIAIAHRGQASPPGLNGTDP